MYVELEAVCGIAVRTAIRKDPQVWLAQDFLERGMLQDVNTYADVAVREIKKRREAEEFRKFQGEFVRFSDLLTTIEDYENMEDGEARFVWVVDKMQAIILGEMDDWLPYRRIGVTHAEFTAKGEEIMDRFPACLRSTLALLNTHSRAAFYDQPAA